MSLLAAIDIGTNSIRLEVVRVDEGGGVSTVSQQKESVRLGEDEFASNRMTEAAIERGVLVCARFADVARGFGAEEIVAFATSAVREAENRDDFVERVREAADLDVRVISGPEEARLIYLGVASGADLGDRRGVFIDIGGGSTEIILGDRQSYSVLESVKLGSIRMAGKFPESAKGPVSPEKFNKMKAHARAVIGHTAKAFRDYGFDVVYGSAGTITNLVDATARRLGDAPATLRNYSIKAADLRATIDQLTRMTFDERRKVPGLDPDRADIILGGAAVLAALLDELGADALIASDRGLRHGIIIDRLAQEAGNEEKGDLSVREKSILQLARTCRFDEDHARHISKLSSALFEELRRLGFHPYGKREREILHYASLVHDIGCFLSHSNHQRHAYYLVRHSDLLGFNDTELAIIANVAYYHRKAMPKKKHENLDGLNRQARKVVEVLAAMLRIAEGLDRSHLGLVRSLRLRRARNPERVVLSLQSESDCQLEIWGVETNRDLFERVFCLPLAVEVERDFAEVAVA